MKKILAVLSIPVLIGLLPSMAKSQGVAVFPRYLIDYPIAFSLPRATFDISARMFPGGGVLTSLNVGMNDRLMVGASFGGINLIGEGKVKWQPFAGAAIRFRLITESFTLPAVAIGFDSQGQGAYDESRKRFERKSPGFFAVASKNYEILEHLSFHVGINRSLETGDGDRDLNLFTGGDLGLSPELAILGEYDFAINDNKDNMLSSGKGFLNFGLRYNIKGVVYFEMYMLDVLKNRRRDIERAVKLTYYELF